eukprot:TRINITY_DN5089_c0_g1_i1.p2 TRINITY_DN5089_c0_g1~~TRINITY_DN5089_c0_g1_i1.p2  ORF type:complete len:150 (-),score=4.25 TRINITY_DN5089_c0_g1_i1:254-703(-)
MSISVHQPQFLITRSRTRSQGKLQIAKCQAEQVKPMMLSIGPTTLHLPLSSTQLQEVATACNSLIKTFQEKSEAKRPKRYDSVEYRYQGSEDEELQYFEIFCNPNAYQTAFDAQLLITIQTQGGIKLTTELMFSAVKQALDVTMNAALQ